MRQEPLWEPGTAVFDKASGMVGVVRARQGGMLILVRPSGLRWHTHVRSVRVVNDRERIQLAALARHHEQAQTLARLRRRRSR
ncbi:hypothetical protein [Streptomyces sp. enrichment culture]|uniref:hypothetical protein n=1 Tax=Streptomyces sp. enrichment culture TaxID=1795815 RepID=UPI003F566D1E